MYNVRQVHAQNIHSWQVTWLISEANAYTDLIVLSVSSPLWYNARLSQVHQKNTMALGASFYLLDILEAPFNALKTLQVCFKYVKKVKRSPKEPQVQLYFPLVRERFWDVV
jgi:hypothetical protein